jgi:hypothetical protein
VIADFRHFATISIEFAGDEIHAHGRAGSRIA